MTGNAATRADRARLSATGWYRWFQTASITAGRPFEAAASRTNPGGTVRFSCQPGRARRAHYRPAVAVSAGCMPQPRPWTAPDDGGFTKSLLDCLVCWVQPTLVVPRSGDCPSRPRSRSRSGRAERRVMPRRAGDGRSGGPEQTPTVPSAGGRRGVAGPAPGMRRAGPAPGRGTCEARAGPWWCAANRAWARRRCWTTWPSTPRAAGWCAPPVSSRRWSLRSPGCISCARRCWTASSVCRLRSGPRCGRRSASVPGRRRTASWSGWPPSSLLADAAEEHPLVCLVDDEQWLDQRLGAGPWVRGASPGRGVGRLGLRGPRAGRRAGGVAGAGGRGAAGGRCPGAAGRGADRAAGRPGPRPDHRRGPRQPAGAAGAAARAAAGGAGGRVRAPRRDAALRADRGELPAAAGRASGRHPACCCWWRRPIRSATRCWCGGQPSGSGSPRRRRRRRPRPACSRSAPACGSGIRWCARRPTGRRRCRSDRTVHRALAEVTDPQLDPDRRAWHRAQAAPGPDEDGRRASWSARPAARRRAGAWPRRPRSWSARPLLTPEPGRRARRLLAAARAKRAAGALDAALGLLVAVEAGPLDAAADAPRWSTCAG